MQLDSTVSLNTVRDVLVDTLGLQNQANALNEDTLLFGSLPELDSMAVLELLLALEQRFGITESRGRTSFRRGVRVARQPDGLRQSARALTDHRG